MFILNTTLVIPEELYDSVTSFLNKISDKIRSETKKTNNINLYIIHSQEETKDKNISFQIEFTDFDALTYFSENHNNEFLTSISKGYQNKVLTFQTILQKI